jgi:hypothetical protein
MVDENHLAFLDKFSKEKLEVSLFSVTDYLVLFFS